MMKKVIFFADESLIQQASHIAALENKTLNELFQEWLSRYVSKTIAEESYQALMRHLSHVQAGKMSDHDEMNERR